MDSYTSPEEWSTEYTNGTTPWDLGGPHPELARRIAELGPVGTAIVPGAGRGHDAGLLAKSGWNVTAIDFAPAVAEHLKVAVGGNGQVVVRDVFNFVPDEPVNLVFDHTFFCALPPTQRSRYGVWAANTVRKGGAVVSIVFPFGRPLAEGGPPFGMSADDLALTLGNDFVLEVDEPAGIPGRQSWPTRWAVFRRRAD